MFSYFLCLFYYVVCEKYCKPITLQYYVHNRASWVPRLTLLDLQVNWTYEHALRMELVRMEGTCCILDQKQ